jgi:Flp pilus assembly protein TadG
MRLQNPKSGRSRWGIRNGAAAAEFALLSPLLVVFIIGMIQMGQGLMAKVTLNNAARKGCSTGASMGMSNADVTNDITDILRDKGYDSSKFNPPSIGSITIAVTDPTGKTLSDVLTAPRDSTVSVRVTIPVSSTMSLVSAFISSSATQSETVVMKKD